MKKRGKARKKQRKVHRGAVAEIDLDAVSHNLGKAGELAAGCSVIAVVKADAYGHGAVEVSKRLVREGVYSLAVAFMDEAVQLRKAGINSSILVLFDKHNVSDFFEYNLIPVVHDLRFASRLSAEAKKRGRKIDLHIKLDTGMGRLGFNNENILEDILAVAGMDNINIAGLMSHFSEADMADRSCAYEQLNRFNEIRKRLPEKLNKGLTCHVANSAATLAFNEACMDAIRPGIMLYGCSPFEDEGEGEGHGQTAVPLKVKAGLKPAMRVKTQVLSIRKLKKGTPISYGGTFITEKDSLVAVLSVGYADGYLRSLSNKAEVIVRGKRAPVAGRVCMDLTIADVTGVEGMAEGDEVVLLGCQGDEEITAWELARHAGTIPYEVLISLGGRAVREYKGLRYNSTEAPQSP